jgi:surface polysaccharide O-acyltransferase-like enzyme
MKKEYLNEVDFMRVCLIVTLVLSHSFAPFSGSWAPIAETQIPAYWWLGNLLRSIVNESFVFISGYVFGFQVRTKGLGLLSLKSIIRSKAMRLLIPSFIFSAIYLLVFGLKDGETFIRAGYSIFNGRGHMWFLPMLMWCFIFISIIEKIKVKRRTILMIVFLCPYLSIVPLPLEFGAALFYFPFFYVGYIIQRNSLNVNSLITPPYKLLIISTLWLLVFAILRWTMNAYFNSSIPCRLLTVFFKVVYSSLGLATIFLACKSISIKHKVPKIIKKIVPLTFGIYLIQQFILQAYYYRLATSSINPYYSPWIAFVIALILSVILAWLLKQTEVGKKYI